MKNYNVKCIEKDALILTGKGDNPLWNSADILIDFVSAWDNKDPDKIEFRALWDTKNIYFCFTPIVVSPPWNFIVACIKREAL